VWILAGIRLYRHILEKWKSNRNCFRILGFCLFRIAFLFEKSVSFSEVRFIIIILHFGFIRAFLLEFHDVDGNLTVNGPTNHMLSLIIILLMLIFSIYFDCG